MGSDLLCERNDFLNWRSEDNQVGLLDRSFWCIQRSITPRLFAKLETRFGSTSPNDYFSSNTSLTRCHCDRAAEQAGSEHRELVDHALVNAKRRGLSSYRIPVVLLRWCFDRFAESVEARFCRPGARLGRLDFGQRGLRGGRGTVRLHFF